MPFRQGKYAEVTVSGVALSTYADQVSFSRDFDVLETTTFTKTAKTYLRGLADGKVDIEGKYDPTVNTGPASLFDILGAIENPLPVVVYPGGNSTGQKIRAFDAVLAGYSESSAVGDIVKFKASFQISGPVIASGI